MSARALVLPLVLGIGLALAAAPDVAAAPRDPQAAALKKANAALAAGRLADAEKQLRKILTKRPKHVGALESLVDVLERQHDDAEAARVADRRMALEPKAPWRARWLTALARVAQRGPDAVAACPDVLAELPRDLSVRLLCAELFAGTEGRLADAVAHYGRALEQAPENRVARLGFARTLSWSGRGAEAAAEYDRLLARDPRDADALIGRGQVARWLGDSGTARVFLQRAVDVDSARAAAWLELARAALDADELPAAARAAESALALRDGKAEAREILATIKQRAREPLRLAREALAAGALEDAERHFHAALDKSPAPSPAHATALEGLVEALLRRGDLLQAAKVADRRLTLEALEPPSTSKQTNAAATPWRRRWFFIVASVDARRGDAVAACPPLVAALPRDFEVSVTCARLLSWTDGRLDDAVKQYRHALSIEPANREARLGLARALAWSAHGEEARQEYDALLAVSADDVGALVGRAQLARWSGAASAALPDLERAVLLAPSDASAWSELAAVELALGRRDAARSSADKALALDAGAADARTVLAAIHTQTPTSVAALSTYYVESPSELTRVNVGARATAYPLLDTRLSLDAVGTRFSQLGEEVNIVVIGAEVEQSLPWRTFLVVDYHPHVFPAQGFALHTGGAALGLRAPFYLRTGARHRALFDATVDRSLLAPLEGVSSGGLPLATIQQGASIAEGFVTAAYAPFRGSYVYVNGELGVVRDLEENLRGSVAAGAGWNPLPLFLGDFPVETTLKYNYFLLHYAKELPIYFSPAFFQVHTGGLELRLKLDEWLVVGAEGLAAYRASAPLGFIASAYTRLRVGDWLSVESRVQRLDDTTFQSLAAGAAIQISF